jgi:hypothetical protein
VDRFAKFSIFFICSWTGFHSLRGIHIPTTREAQGNYDAVGFNREFTRRNEEGAEGTIKFWLNNSPNVTSIFRIIFRLSGQTEKQGRIAKDRNDEESSKEISNDQGEGNLKEVENETKIPKTIS